MAKRPVKPKRPWPGGAGGPEVWRNLAAARLGVAQSHADDLKILGLAAMPATLAELKTAYRQAMLMYHPDRGGHVDDAIEATRAYDRLTTLIGGKP